MVNPKYLKLEQQAPNDWAFNCPSEWEFFDRRLNKVEALIRDGNNEKAIEVCVEIITSCPEYLPGLNKLGLLFRDQGELDKAIPMFLQAVKVGLACIPNEFERGTDLIPWHWEDNRAFLLACEYVGLCNLDEALESYEFLLDISPGYRGYYESVVPHLHKILNIEDEDGE